MDNSHHLWFYSLKHATQFQFVFHGCLPFIKLNRFKSCCTHRRLQWHELGLLSETAWRAPCSMCNSINCYLATTRSTQVEISVSERPDFPEPYWSSMRKAYNKNWQPWRRRLKYSHISNRWLWSLVDDTSMYTINSRAITNRQQRWRYGGM